MRTLDFVEKENLRRDLPPFKVGDTVAVHATVREGDKERIQVFQGLVIRRRGGGVGETFTVRKVSSGVGVERIFPVQSPLVTKVEIKARGYVRRARLYYLRELSGKKARLHSKVRDLSGLISEEEADALENAAEVVAAPLEEVEEAAVERVAETDADGSAAKDLKGKARKKARAAEKEKRRLELAEQEKQRAARKAKEAKEAEAAQAAAEAEAASSAESGDDAAEKPAEQ